MIQQIKSNGTGMLLFVFIYPSIFKLILSNMRTYCDTYCDSSKRTEQNSIAHPCSKRTEHNSIAHPCPKRTEQNSIAYFGYKRTEKYFSQLSFKKYEKVCYDFSKERVSTYIKIFYCSIIKQILSSLFTICL